MDMYLWETPWNPPHLLHACIMLFYHCGRLWHQKVSKFDGTFDEDSQIKSIPI